MIEISYSPACLPQKPCYSGLHWGGLTLGLASDNHFCVPGIWTKIFFTTKGGGLYACSILTDDVSLIVNSTQDIYGVAFNAMNDKLYYSTYEKIYSASEFGTDVQIAFSSTNCKLASLLTIIGSVSYLPLCAFSFGTFVLQMGGSLH